MSRLIACSLLGVLALAVAGEAHATTTVVDFEGVGTSSLTPIPSGYDGLTWGSNTWSIGGSLYPGTGYEYGTFGNYSSFSAYSQTWEVGFPTTVTVDPLITNVLPSGSWSGQ